MSYEKIHSPKFTIRFKNPSLKEDQEKLVEDAGRHISMNALLEMALEEALPVMRRKIRELRSKKG